MDGELDELGEGETVKNMSEHLVITSGVSNCFAALDDNSLRLENFPCILVVMTIGCLQTQQSFQFNPDY